MVLNQKLYPIFAILWMSFMSYSFSFPEEMDALIDFLFVGSLFLSVRPSKNIKKSDIKILV